MKRWRVLTTLMVYASAIIWVSRGEGNLIGAYLITAGMVLWAWAVLDP